MENESLHKQIQFYQTIVNLSHDAIVGVDNQGSIVVYNQAAANMIGVPVDDALGKIITEVNPKAGLPRVLAEQSEQHDELRQIGLRRAIVNRAPIYLEGQMIGAVSTVRDITELQQYEESIRRKMVDQGLQAKWSLEHMVARARPMQRLLELAHRYAAVDSTVLIQGESGTGKEMLAQGIHLASPRKKGPFVALNCAALPETLLESELFGYEDGAFTGARKGGKPGLFEMAHRGTLFLDEIGELPIAVQARLLRALQERAVMRIGGNRVMPVDVRIIAATNRDLVQQVNMEMFRQDLYFRIAVLVLTIPPLRERTEDIPWLIEAFLQDWQETERTANFHLSEADIRKLQAYSWPGNVRELRNLLERALVLADAEDDIQLFSPDVWLPVGWFRDLESLKAVERTENELEETEMERIRRVLDEEDGHVERAARRLGIHRTTLWRKLRT